MLVNGLWAVLTTPFSNDGEELDEGAMRQQVDYAIRSGASGLVALGVLGEALQLDAQERADVARVVGEAAPDLPLVLGLTERDTGPAIESARRVLDAVGRSASLMVQVQSADPDELATHLDGIYEATGAGIVVQDYPGVSGVVIRVQDLLSALKGRDYIVAIKSESPPTSAAIAELTAQTHIPVYGGLGGLGLLDELAAGAAGVMTGFSFPEALVRTLEAWRVGGYPAAREVYAPWLPLVNFEAQAAIGLSIRKSSLVEQGVLNAATVRPPGRPMPEVLLPMLRQHLEYVS